MRKFYINFVIMLIFQIAAIICSLFEYNKGIIIFIGLSAISFVAVLYSMFSIKHKNDKNIEKQMKDLGLM